MVLSCRYSQGSNVPNQNVGFDESIFIISFLQMKKHAHAQPGSSLSPARTGRVCFGTPNEQSVYLLQAFNLIIDKLLVLLVDSVASGDARAASSLDRNGHRLAFALIHTRTAR